VLNGWGVVELHAPGAGSIPAEIDCLLKDRASWEEHYRHRLQWSENRVRRGGVRVNDRVLPWDDGGLDFLRKGERDYVYGLYCGSLYGQIRNMLGLENSCFLQVDDEALFDEIIVTVGELSFRNVEYALASGAKFDFAHFWEDICFKNGPLISPTVFAEKVGPHYRRITDLVHDHGIDIVSLDCDGKIDALVPVWLENGVNTMFPIEVGTWNASIAPWRELFGREVRGVGGMNKTVFARDRKAVDAEIERLRPLVELGGFIPCPDHRIAPDAEWDLVRYYCDRMREVFS
jgi:uroporphyrinogen decarboxylase